MTASNDLFFELDTQVYVTLKCGDGSVTKIEGCGTIILACKNREHRAGNMVRSLPPLDQVDQLCDGCLISKQRRASFPTQV
jgi:hypothetical protein